MYGLAVLALTVSAVTCITFAALALFTPRATRRSLHATVSYLRSMQSASHSSWVHISGFFFVGGALHGFEKGAFTPPLVAALHGCLAAVLPAAFFAATLGLFSVILLVVVGWLGEISARALGGRDRRVGGERGGRRQEEPRKEENERSGRREVAGNIFPMCE
jgi:hypothetical protein